MTPTKVFISSVITGFEAQRAAARSAVESLRLQPIMAERDFGAKPYTSQEACLDGVRQCDIYLGIFGTRYGFVTASGKSVSEEEFLEARAHGKPVLCFVQNGEKEEDQQAFLSRIGTYEEGYFFEFFDTAEHLERGVVRALNDLVNQPGITTLDQPGLAQHLHKYRWGSPTRGGVGTWLGAVTFPLRQGEPYVSALRFEDQDFQEALLQPARFGKSRLLDQELGAVAQVHAKYISFEQRDEHRQLTSALEIHTDGTLVFRSMLGRVQSGTLETSFFRNMVVDESDVQMRLGRLIDYARQFYDGLEHSSLVAALGMGVSLSGLEHKGFGVAPSRTTTTMTMPQRLPSDPLLVPPNGLKLARSQLADASQVAAQLTRYIALAFKDSQAYYAKSD